jgi:hypothetical protein
VCVFFAKTMSQLCFEGFLCPFAGNEGFNRHLRGSRLLRIHLMMTTLVRHSSFILLGTDPTSIQLLFVNSSVSGLPAEVARRYRIIDTITSSSGSNLQCIPVLCAVKQTPSSVPRPCHSPTTHATYSEWDAPLAAHRRWKTQTCARKVGVRPSA